MQVLVWSFEVKSYTELMKNESDENLSWVI